MDILNHIDVLNEIPRAALLGSFLSTLVLISILVSLFMGRYLGVRRVAWWKSILLYLIWPVMVYIALAFSTFELHLVVPAACSLPPGLIILPIAHAFASARTIEINASDDFTLLAPSLVQNLEEFQASYGRCLARERYARRTGYIIWIVALFGACAMPVAYHFVDAHPLVLIWFTIGYIPAVVLLRLFIIDVVHTKPYRRFARRFKEAAVRGVAEYENFEITKYDEGKYASPMDFQAARFLPRHSKSYGGSLLTHAASLEGTFEYARAVSKVYMHAGGNRSRYVSVFEGILLKGPAPGNRMKFHLRTLHDRPLQFALGRARAHILMSEDKVKGEFEEQLLELGPIVSGGDENFDELYHFRAEPDVARVMLPVLKAVLPERRRAKGAIYISALDDVLYVGVHRDADYLEPRQNPVLSRNRSWQWYYEDVALATSIARRCLPVMA